MNRKWNTFGMWGLLLIVAAFMLPNSALVAKASSLNLAYAKNAKCTDGHVSGDFDGDGKTDVFSIQSSGQWRMSSAGTATYIKLGYDPAQKLSGLRFGDFDGDCKTDVFSVQSSGQWRMSSGGTAGYIKLGYDPDRTIKDLRFGDFDGDGKTDVFSVQSSGQWRMSSSGTAGYIKLGYDPDRTIDELRFGNSNDSDIGNDEESATSSVFLPVLRGS